MKKILFCLVAALFLAACEKDAPEQPVVPEPEPEQPEVEMFERRVIKLPIVLPDDVEQRLIDAPCWIASSTIHYMAYVSNTDVTIYDEKGKDVDGGPANNTYKFYDNNVLVNYFNRIPSIDTDTINHSWTRQNIVEYTDSTVLFTHGDLNKVGTITIYKMRLYTQEHMDKMLANLINYWKRWDFYNSLKQDEIAELLMSKPCWSGVRYKGRYASGKVSIISEDDLYENDNREQTFAFDETDYYYYYFTPEQGDVEVGYFERHKWKKANIISSTEDEVIAILDPEIRYIEGREVEVYMLKPSTQEHLDSMKAVCEMKK